MIEVLVDNNKEFHPFVSVIMPVYNGFDYMREAIESVLAQTYKNIEVVLVNDGSTDNTEEIAKSYGDKIRYFAKKNGGVASALNYAIREAKGEYISWLSHDDVYYPDKIEKQIRKLSELPEADRANTILYSNFSLIDEKSEPLFKKQFHKSHDAEKLDYPFYPILNGIIHGCTLLIPKHCFEEVGYFDEKLKTTQDYDLWFQMFPKYNILFMPDILVKSRWHAEQGSKKIKNAHQEGDSLWIKMIENLTDEQRTMISGSNLIFYENTLDIVRHAQYFGAAEYIKDKISAWKSRDIAQIKVSVIVPFHNRIEWLIQAVESVQKQTHKNLEIVLVNDASSENMERIRKLADGDSRIKQIDNKRSRGAAGARNTGIDAATGEFAAFLDSDDLLLPKKIKTQLEYMVRGGHLFSHTSYFLFHGEGGGEKIMPAGKKDYEYPGIVAVCGIAAPTVMVHRDLLQDKKNRFPEEYAVGEDICLWIRLAKISASRGMAEALTKVREHKTQAAYDKEKQVQGLANILHFSVSNFLNQETAGDIRKLNKDFIAKLNKSFKREKLAERILENKFILSVSKSFLFENKVTIPIKKFILKHLYRRGVI